MIQRGAVYAFPEVDPRPELQAAADAMGLPRGDAVVALQGGPTAGTWGYVTCALAWHSGSDGSTTALGDNYTARPLPLHRFPTAYLTGKEALFIAKPDSVNALIDQCLSDFKREIPNPIYPRGTVFTGSVEAVVPETDGYGGTLQSFPKKALVALSDVGPDTVVIPVLVGTTQEPPMGAADWVYKRTVPLASGRESTIWIMCHELHTKTTSLATQHNLFRGYEKYPITPKEYSEMISRVRFALSVGA